MQVVFINMTQVLSTPKRIIKTLGHPEDFDIKKLEYAINASVESNNELKENILNHVLERIKDKITTSTRYINDIIESYLIRNNHHKELGKYIENRLQKNKEYSDKINLLGTDLVTSPYFDKQELQDFTINQIQIAANRYLQKNMETGNIMESMTGWFDRVASHVVLGSVVYDEKVYDKEGKQIVHDIEEYDEKKLHKLGYRSFGDIKIQLLFRLYQKLNLENKMRYSFEKFSYEVWDLAYPDHSMSDKYQQLYQKYFNYMYSGFFEPNTPTLMNAGTKVGGLSACFTLGIDDNMDSIGMIWHDSAMIFKNAGGLGVNISYIRPKGSNIDGTYGAASGPISLVLRMINSVTDEVKSGGKRRGANMGLMEYWHPQIEEFITMKKTPGYLENFNVSVMFDNKFWDHYHSGTDYDLTFNGEVYGKMSARGLIENIAVSAWSSAEPGVAFKDNANRANPLLGLKGDINICNPCAEQFMYSGESCTLGSINLAKLVREDGTFDWDGYVNLIHDTTRFLNDVLEVNKYPTEHIAEESEKSKRIGLGIMGLADLFFRIGVKYNSEEGYVMMNELSKTLYVESVKESIDLAEERGSCYWYDEMVKENPVNAMLAIKRNYNSMEEIEMGLGTEYYTKFKNHGIRNMWTTTIAPTGTISMIADTSSGLEPIFSLVFSKLTNAGKYYYTSELFKQALIKEGIYSQALLEKVERNYGSCQGIDEIPEHIQRVFVTAMDIHWMDHVVAQSVWQNWIDNSISKTINMPYNVTVSDVKNAYILAHDLGLKGIALFRDGSREEQVLHVGSNVQSNKNEQTVQKDTPGTVSAPIRNQVERQIKPSNYAMNYIKDRVNDELNTDLEEHVKKASMYLEKGEECPQCHNMTLILEGGCESCKNPECAFATCKVA